MKKLCGIACLCILAGVMPLFAQMYPDGGVTVNEVSQVLQDEGYWLEITKASDGSPKILSKAEGYSFAIYFFGLSDSGRARSIQFCLGIDMEDGVELDTVNEWNSGYRFARMYRDEENDPILEYDIDVERGCTPEAIANGIDRWVALIETFDSFLDDKQLIARIKNGRRQLT
jgi:hypothetical protein